MPVTVDAAALANLERRIGHLEHSLARMQLDGRVQYKRGFAAAMKARLCSREMPDPQAAHENLEGTNYARY